MHSRLMHSRHRLISWAMPVKGFDIRSRCIARSTKDFIIKVFIEAIR